MNYYPDNQVNDGVTAPEPSVAEPPMPVEESAWIDRHDLAQNEDHYRQVTCSTDG